MESEFVTSSTWFSTLLDMIETKHYLSLAVAQTQDMFITSIVISCPGFWFRGTMFFQWNVTLLQNTSSESSITVIKAQIDGMLRLIIHFDQQNCFWCAKKKSYTPNTFSIKAYYTVVTAESWQVMIPRNQYSVCLHTHTVKRTATIEFLQKRIWCCDRIPQKIPIVSRL